MILSTIELKGDVIVQKKMLLEGDVRIATHSGESRYPFYEGEYIVTPKTFEQSLDTDYKVMSDDVTILEIPYNETSNIYGTTVAIATE